MSRSRLVQSIRTHVAQQAGEASADTQLGEVTSTSPLTISLLASSITLDSDEITYPQSMVAYDADSAVDVGDTVVLLRKKTGGEIHWVVMHVLSDKAPFTGRARVEALEASVASIAAYAPGDVKAVSYAVTAGAEPAGWLLGDGRLVGVTTYAALFAKTGHVHNGGVDPGGGQFRLLDAQSRALTGAGAGAGLVARALGAKYGSEPSNMPSHFHTIHGGADFFWVYEPGGPGPNVNGAGTLPSNALGVTDSSGGGSATDGNVPPSLALTVLVKT